MIDDGSYGDQMLEYFITGSNQIPPIFINPPRDLDTNITIDDEGHIALHWACAIGRIRIVKFPPPAGADVFKVNESGQTALMRSVVFANNYDVRKFLELYELLHRSTLNIDNYNRTVFHHIVDVAMSKGQTHATRYYMKTVLTRLSEYPRELGDIIFQDEDRETALTVAARCRSKRLVKLLIPWARGSENCRPRARFDTVLIRGGTQWSMHRNQSKFNLFPHLKYELKSTFLRSRRWEEHRRLHP
jgi:hypothetical protein